MKKRLLGSRGVSLTELMVACVILSIGILASFASFRYITQSIQRSRTKTIAANIVSEKMEVLKNYSYFGLMVSSDTTIDNNYDPPIEYDTSNYPPETITLWGQPVFTRAVHVAYADMSGATISTVAFNSNDTGIKRLTIYVLWREGGTYKKVEVKNLLANPSAAGLDSGFNGFVTINGGGNLEGAQIEVVGNSNWHGASDSTGFYGFQVARGSYSLICSSAGFFTQATTQLVASRGVYASKNFSMVRIASGTIAGTVWVSSYPVISQVVASSGTSGGGEIEWVELYNPTTFTWTMNAANFQLIYKEKNTGAAAAQIALQHNVTSLPPRRYYLIASTSPVIVSGVSVVADAQYAAQADEIQDNSDGGLGIRANATATYWDRIAWKKSSGPDPPSAFIEGTELSLNPGLQDGEQFIRYSSTAGPDPNLGNSYDSNNNYYNFAHYTSPQSPRTTSTTRYPVAGVPATRAYVAATDGLSTSTEAVTYGGNYPYAQFTLTGVATGTWHVVMMHDTTQLEIDTVTVTANATTRVSSATTSPSWLVSGYNSSMLVSTTSGGFVKGFVYGSNAASPLSNILVDANGVTGRTTAGGAYFINTPAGAVTVTANSGLSNSNYSTTSENVTVNEGEVTEVAEMFLPQGGTITGYVWTGTGALPNIAVKAQVGVREYAATSDATGRFYISAATSAVSYTVSPVLDTLQVYNTAPTEPLTASLTTPGSSVFVGTITVTGGLGAITGTVKKSGASITTGVLILASIGAISDPPPTIVASSAPALSNPFYAASSKSDGTYRIDVRAGTYNVKAFYPRVNPNDGAVTYATDSESSVSVTAGVVTENIDLAW